MIRYIALGVLIFMLANTFLSLHSSIDFPPLYWLDAFRGISLMPFVSGLACIVAFIISQITGWAAFRNQNYGFSMLWATVPVVAVKVIATFLL
ncbi:MAG: hypothetical protein LC115_11545 [Bacteroidia bacterium]|nr:hypothetical protein [Bacteroidia bacterium]